MITQKTETSHYLEEKKSTEILKVVVSEIKFKPFGPIFVHLFVLNFKFFIVRYLENYIW